MKNQPLTKKFFAAANSFNGFVSYFDCIFDSKDFSKIYVLKGGPGTGKSSLMRSVKENFIAKNIDVEEIYCSSDPNSLDAIIFRNNDKKIAIIDGTAPHERDAIIPGAIDTIINLADNLDMTWLSPQRDNIIKLNQEKKYAYKTAYSYLSVAGKCDEYITNVYEKLFDRIKAKNKAEELLSEITSSNNPKIKVRLISSFGKLGEYTLDTLKDISKSTISIFGDEICTKLLLDTFYDTLKRKQTTFTRFVCPKRTSSTDALFIPDCSISVVRGITGEIDADSFITLKNNETEKIKVARSIKREALEESKRWFNIAADIHFQLEDIYIRAMMFEKNNEIVQSVSTEIKKILDL